MLGHVSYKAIPQWKLVNLSILRVRYIGVILYGMSAAYHKDFTVFKVQVFHIILTHFNDTKLGTLS